jgi:uncharacterized protein YydD (DUF2326 family)
LENLKSEECLLKGGYTKLELAELMLRESTQKNFTRVLEKIQKRYENHIEELNDRNGKQFNKKYAFKEFLVQTRQQYRRTEEQEISPAVSM